MKRRDFMEKWGLAGLKLPPRVLAGRLNPRPADRAAAWELYVELATRITTQPLPDKDGDEKTALDSVAGLFPLTRDVLKRHGPGCAECARLAIPVLNQVVRPFTAKWLKLALAGAFKKSARCAEFRRELAALQVTLRSYTGALAALGKVRLDGQATDGEWGLTRLVPIL